MSLESYLVLDNNPVQFEPVTAVNGVFFDEANKQILTVRSGGATGIVVKGRDESKNCSFQLHNKSSLISIKFSHQHKILAFQRSETSIEFTSSMDENSQHAKISQSSKGPNSKILTFHWVSRNEIVFVTLTGIEFYQINQSKGEIKPVKTYDLPIVWSVFLAESFLLLCQTSLKSGSLCPFFFKDGKVHKLPPFDTDILAVPKTDQPTDLPERDVTMVNLYGDVFVAILRHPTTPSEYGTKVDLYLLSREARAKKMYTLVTSVAGRFAISVLDNLLVIHHQASKSSMIFDIRLHNGKNKPATLYPVTDPVSIRSHKIEVYGCRLSQEKTKIECQLYAPTWIVFQPNIIIDVALGCMWFLQIKLDAIVAAFKDSALAMDFLLLRRGSKPIVLKVLKKLVLQKNGRSTYAEVRMLFDKLNIIYKKFTHAEKVYIRNRKQEASSPTASGPYPVHRTQIVVDQSDMYTHVLCVMAKESGVDQTHVCKVAIEYLKSLNDHQLGIQHYLYELIINSLMISENFYVLEQYIQNGVIADSRMTAAYLQSKACIYPSVCHLAVDMWKRVTACHDEIIDALLSVHKILEAMRFTKVLYMQNTVSARKFLEAARESGNDMLFYETYKFFQIRNYSLRGTKDFAPGEQCDEFITYYKNRFV